MAATKKKTTTKTAARKTLVIVESPSKAKTIGKYLGSNYKVIASVGHVRDLPKSKLGIDIENDFEPQYIAIRGKGDIIKEMRKEAKKASKVYLATDPDREGEAISWHLANLLDMDSDAVCRVVFNEHHHHCRDGHCGILKERQRDQYGSGGRAAGKKSAGSFSWLSDQPASLAKNQKRLVCRQGAVGGAENSLRQRKGNSAV